MKKLLLSLAALAAVASASAFQLKEPGKITKPLNPAFRSVEIPAEFVKTAPAPLPASRAESEEVLYTLAGNPAQIFGYNNAIAGMQMAMAMQMDPTFVSQMVGNQITKISFYTGRDYSVNVNKLTRATVFITNDLTAEPVITQQTACPSQSASQVVVDLDTPYTIEAGKKVYVGVYYTLNSPENLPIITDFTAHSNDYGGWFGIRSTPSANWSWDNIASDFGFVCVGAMVKGDNFAKNSVAVTAVEAMPAFYQNSPFEAVFLFQNNGTNDVNNITVEYDIDGEGTESGIVAMKTPLPFNQSSGVRLTGLTCEKPAKSAALNIRVTHINGEPNTCADNSGSYPVTVIPTGMGFERNVVVEEFTSTSCVYCPVGYTGMEYVRENYTSGDLIPVAVHVNSPNKDPMTALTFNNVYSRYCTAGVPSAIMNRTYNVYPTPEELVETFEGIRSLPAIAKVTAEAAYDEAAGTITVDTKTSFSFDYTDGDSQFGLSYAVTENNVGPYTQQNGYAGAQGDYLGWQSKPSEIDLVYNDVARQLDSFTGVKGSVPAEITAAEEYSYSRAIKPVSAIRDINRVNVVVYLLNKKTGAIENAAFLPSAAITGLAGIENVVADTPDATLPAEYFNLQGQRLANPAPGTLVIRRQGNTAAKVIL